MEFGSKAVRAGILTQKPSLPHTFMLPLCALGNVENDHVKIIAGVEALGIGWPLVEPIQVLFFLIVLNKLETILDWRRIDKIGETNIDGPFTKNQRGSSRSSQSNGHSLSDTGLFSNIVYCINNAIQRC